MRRRVALMAALTAGLAACAPAIRPTLKVERELAPSDYPQVLNLWTRSAQMYRLFEHKMTITATVVTPMFRRAFQVRFPEIYGYGGQITRRELVELSDKSEETLNFFIAVYTPQDKWNDLDKPESIWRLTLARVDPKTGKVAPTINPKSIERVKIDENLHTVYPYLTVFDTGYVVRFPMTAADGQMLIREGENTIELRVVSSFGHAELRWTLLP